MQPVGVTAHVFSLRTLIANVIFISEPAAVQGNNASWILVDAGMPGCAGAILAAARRLFGPASPPSAIVLTHGHFDHVGSLDRLLEAWTDAPVYAHPLALPFLTGRADYPPPDPLVGGGLFSLVSRAFPRHGIDLGERVLALPDDGGVPGASAWRWIHTPGHAPGHVSLFRDGDRTLVAGDAVTTVKQESVLAVLSQRRKVHGPPAYFTIDWEQARLSVGRLADLDPATLVTGHGLPLHGAAMREQLRELAGEFDTQAQPAFGRYVATPARTDQRGIVSIPPDPLPGVMARVLTATAALTAAGVLLRRRLAAAR
jgi:glyoxylase-like metal-dependent hydrolase (beta-lactamase superfamily II)